MRLAKDNVKEINDVDKLRELLIENLKKGTWMGIYDSISLLLENTDKGKTIDPFADPDGSLWNLLWNSLYFQGKLYFEALTVAQSFLDSYHNLQEKHQERIHKGTPLQYLGLAFFSIGQLEQARKFHFLAFIEDVLRCFESEKSKGALEQPQEVVVTPATIALETRFRVTKTQLKKLQEFTWGIATSAIPFYPEQILSQWLIESDKKLEIIERSTEERRYRTNLHYLRRLKKEAFADTTGKALELFAFYVFSCVDGFEPILRKQTSAFHFDVLVRNLIKDHRLIEGLGEYIGIECKNLSEKVSAKELDHFIHKLRLHNMKCGVIFTTKGISGTRYRSSIYGTAIIEKTFQRDGIVIFDITKEDIENLSNGRNLLSLLLKKYEDTRFR